MQESFYTWGQFAPAFSLVGLAAGILMADAFLPRVPKKAYALIGAMGAFVAACFMLGETYTSLFGSLACFATALALLLAFDYTKVTCASIAGEGNQEGTGEFYALPLIASAGIYGLTISHDIIMLFVNLEIITLTSYILAGYFRRNQGSVEAGVKYLILGAMSTGLLVFGAAWYFGTTGSFDLTQPAAINAITGAPAAATGFLVAIALMLAGAFFKVGAAPMHLWIPDVYQGAPTPTSVFLAVASKTAGFALLCTLVTPLLMTPSLFLSRILMQAFAIVAAATLLIGNLGALSQLNAKRLLGYSSIGQAGFILIFFVTIAPSFQGPTFFYLLAYGLATVVAFYAIAMVRTQRGSEEISAFRGLGKTNPRTAFLLLISLASLAGVPLTAGFIAKMAAFLSLVNVMGRESSVTWLLPIMIICAAAGFYYYFKIIRAMYWEKPKEEDKPLQVPPCTMAVLIICSAAIILLGTLPLLVE